MHKALYLSLILISCRFFATAQTWEKNYSGSPEFSRISNFGCYDYTEAKGGLMCVDGGSDPSTYIFNTCLIRINRYGDTLWTKWNSLDAYGMRATPNSIAQLTNGDYIIGATLTPDNLSHDDDYGFFCRIDSNGKLLHSMRKGYTYYGYSDAYHNVMKTNDGGYYITYSKDSFYNIVEKYNDFYERRNYIDKYDSNNILLWSKSSSDILVTPSFEFKIIADRSANDEIVYFLANKIGKINSDGTLNYEFYIDSPFSKIRGVDYISCTSDSGFLMRIYDSTTRLCKFDRSGKLIHSFTIDSVNPSCYAVELSNGKYLTASYEYNGFHIYDKNLNLLDSITRTPKQNKGYILALVPNKQGGAFYTHTIYDTSLPRIHIGAVNFDSLFNIHHHLAISMYSNCLVPGDTSHLHVSFANIGTRNIDSTTAIVVLDSNVSFISSVPPPVSISGDTLLYTIDSLHDGITDSVVISLYIDTSLGLGALLTFHSMSPYINNIGIGDDTTTYCGTTISSLDPNFKSVNRQYNFTPDKPLVYTIGFENTGNYFAKKVVILDTIDSHLDVTTLKVLGASPKNPTLTWTNDHVVTFTFSDIHLPDSASDPEGAHGQVVYSINTKSTASINDAINNTAYIFFDYNDPVVTNTTTNIISKANGPRSDTSKTLSNNFTVSPNPSTGIITINLPSSSSIWNITLSDAFGKVHSKEIYTGNTISINPKVPQGVYFLKATSIDGKQNLIKKIVRE
ncbi:MAG: putative rane-anchored cell surface protein [Flavipsychrobacter sp.]|nr:putative rane-anchored cell surface protein [Flavipsychrobacter sp.]